MIVQTFIVILILSVALICDVTGTSYSNVYVESELVPMGYYSYGTPYPSIANPGLSQINSLPVPGYVGPCVSPCVYPAQPVATVAPVNPSPNVLTYNAPSVPVVVAPTKQEATGYEYSYVVYDENTGDHKAQRELSDGSVVRGEYSFLQPDGYIRQVQYVADDISGFNAVVKQFLPAAVEDHSKVQGQENKESSTPCHEIKNGSLKEEASEKDSGEISINKIMKIHERLLNKYSNEESAEKAKGNHGTSKVSGEDETSQEKYDKETKKVSNEESGEESEAEPRENYSKKPKNSQEASREESEEKSKEKQHIKPKQPKEESGEESEEKSKEKSHIKPKTSNEDSGEESKEKHHYKSKQVSSEDSGEDETLHNKSKESAGESKEKYHKKAKKEYKESGEESGEDTDSEESKEELNEKSRKKSSKGTDKSREKNKKKSETGSKEGSDEDSGEESEDVGHGKHKEVHGLLKPNQEALVPYNDILRCIEAAMRRNYGVPAAMRQEPSPLTYIILNKPC